VDLLSSIKLFVKTVDEGSFSEVGRQLHLAPSSISRKINALEEELGVRLLQRTTRNISLTEAGDTYYTLVSKILNDLTDAQLAITQLQANPQGILRVSVAAPFGERKIIPLLPELLTRYPKLAVDITLEDRAIDLVETRVDLAIRIGSLNDSSLIARKLASNKFVVCGSTNYFNRAGIPNKPQDLKQHNCIVNRHIAYANNWQFTRNNVIENISAKGNFTANTGGAIYRAIRSDLGIAVLPTWYVNEKVEQGLLQTVLNDYHFELPSMTDSAIYAVYPAGQFLPPKVRVFIDYFIEKLNTL